MASSNNPHMIFCMIGAPGSGKGTLCRRLSDDYSLYHFSVGDYMREISRDSQSSEREIVQEYLQQGKLLPTKVILSILQRKFEEEGKRGHRNFLVDGFPRELSQSLEFENKISSPVLVISIRCPREIAKQRYLSRRLPDRLTDDAEMFEKRFDEFDANNPAIVDYYRVAGILQEIDSSTETEVTYRVLLAALNENDAWKTTMGRAV